MSYVSDGRFRADAEKDHALRLRDLARSYFRSGCPGMGKACMSRAIRAWKQYRFFKTKAEQPQ